MKVARRCLAKLPEPKRSKQLRLNPLEYSWGKRVAVALSAVGLMILGWAVSGTMGPRQSDSTASHSDDPAAKTEGSQVTSTLPGSDVGSEADRPSSESSGNEELKRGLESDWAYASWVRGVDSLNDPRPLECPEFKGGAPCTFRFQGNYLLRSSSTGVVRLGAYEDDKSEPTAQAETPVKGPGSGKFYGSITYVPSQDAKSVRFRVTLLDAEGKVLFQTKASEELPMPVN